MVNIDIVGSLKTHEKEGEVLFTCGKK